MINEEILRHTLIFSFEHLKRQHLLLTDARDEIRALRETVEEMDGDLFSATLKRSRQRIKDSQVHDQVAQEYDDIIRRVKDGEVC